MGGKTQSVNYTITSEPLQNPTQYNLQFVKSYQDENRTPYTWQIILTTVIGVDSGILLILMAVL